MSQTVAPSRTAASVIDGRARTDAPGGRLSSTNPAHTEELVAELLLADADTFVDECRAARSAQPEWARVPAPIRGRVIAQVRRLGAAGGGPRPRPDSGPRDRAGRPPGGGQQGAVGAVRKARDRQAVRRITRR